MSIEVEGMDRVRELINRLEDLKPAKAALLAGGEQIKAKIAKYPEATEANQARGFNSVYNWRTRRPINYWYQRGYGAKRVRKDGSIVGRKTSETLGRKWTTATRDGGLTVVVGNSTSYGPFVQDRDKQARFHKARGWQTAQDVVEKETPAVIKFIEDELEKALK